jgi:L-serine dehydratase
MFLSVFDMFKVGIGPSSSHTMGPMVAAARFLDRLRGSPFHPKGLKASLHGSLAFTGVGHATDRATILGLAGFSPDTYDAAKAEAALARIAETHLVEAPGLPPLQFDPKADLTFDYGPALPGHANGMILKATDGEGDVILQETYYSIGGGFVLTAAELAEAGGAKSRTKADVPWPFETGAEMLEMAQKSGLSIAAMKRANELKFRSPAELDRGMARIWEVMNACISRGMEGTGILPGGLKVRRRAKGIHDALDHVPGASPSKVGDFLLTAAAIGGLCKHNASISGAECGCQAEVGSASAMAAAGLAAVLGGTPEQVENAAEIALEHHLGMTCDPIKGLVQVPCIERNGLGAIKAVSAASLSLRGDGQHLVSLDACIETMRQTGHDMHEKYKETSLGGLAVNVPNC